MVLSLFTCQSVTMHNRKCIDIHLLTRILSLSTCQSISKSMHIVLYPSMVVGAGVMTGAGYGNEGGGLNLEPRYGFFFLFFFSYQLFLLIDCHHISAPNYKNSRAQDTSDASQALVIFFFGQY